LCLAAIGRYEEAVQRLRRTIEIDPSRGASGSHWGIAKIYEKQGLYDEAIRELDEARRLDPRPSWRVTGNAGALALAGRRQEALESLAQILEMRKQQYVSPFAIGETYAALGDKDQAFVWLNKAIDEREIIVVYLKKACHFRCRLPAYATILDGNFSCSASD
jgi:tetratricopeptide (TPR) repeat protein